MGRRQSRDGLILDLEPDGSDDHPSRLGLGRRLIDFRPPPPDDDVLETPLVMVQRPRVILPQRTWLDRHFDGFLTVLRTDEEAKRQQAHRTIAELIAMAWPRMLAGLRQKGWLTDIKHPLKPIRHAQHLIEPLEKMIAVPPQLATERRALEILLTMILRELSRKLSERKKGEFIFETKSRLYGLIGYKYERILKGVDLPEDRFDIIQEIINNYFQSIHYYHCSLLARDFPINEGTLFGLYCRAVFFMARVDQDGRLRPTPVRERLPRRDRILFLLTRDKALRRRYGRDQNYAERIRALVRAFPDQK